jgi:protein gp37
MGQNSSIEWTDHTFNPWWGCSKVSPACQNCYAELWAKRTGHQVWGNRSHRRFFTDDHWNQPLVWDKEARLAKQQRRVFCASMADVFEDRAELVAFRSRLWSLIAATPWLNWLLLSKRPENIGRMVPWGKHWPGNVWLGTTVESQAFAELRLPELLKYPAKVRFVSCEPLLGSVDLRRWIKRGRLRRIDWVIAGGESGPRARAMHPDWATGLLHQCRAFGVPFHFKQWGNWVPADLRESRSSELIEFGSERPVRMTRLSKKSAGRLLEGSVWNELPTTVCHDAAN